MLTSLRMLWIAAAVAAPAAAQLKPDAKPDSQPAPQTEPIPTATLDSIAPAQRPLVRARAQHFFRMPDGALWDGWGYFEHRKIIGYAVKAFDKNEPGQANPGQTLVEDRAIGTVWKIKPTREALAWGLTERLGTEEIPPGRFEGADRRQWLDTPPLWYSSTVQEYSWPFAYIDETEPDDFTRLTHGGYLEVTRDWGDGRYDFKGYSLDRGTLEGVVVVTDPVRFIKKDRFKGTFFLWPQADAHPTPGARQSWRLIPADELRASPDDLADALLNAKARLTDWRFDIIKEKVVWKRTIHPVERAAERPAPNPTVKPPKPPSVPAGGPDLLILNDGRWFRGKIIRNDTQSVIIRTFVGQSEMDMTFKPDEVKEIQAPEKR